MNSLSAKRQWYVRRNGMVRGPFLDEYIGRYILLGRIRLNDELSQDSKSWQPVTNFPQLFPEELCGLSSWDDCHKLVLARIKYDERISDRRMNRSMEPPREERRKLPDRRCVDSNAALFRNLLLNKYLDSTHWYADHARQPIRVFLLAALLVCLVVYFSTALR